jgi:hypothetical protein
MCRFFLRKLEKVPQRDLDIVMGMDELEAGYRYSEELFAKEFTGFMDKLGAIPIGEEGSANLKN